MLSRRDVLIAPLALATVAPLALAQTPSVSLEKDYTDLINGYLLYFDLWMYTDQKENWVAYCDRKFKYLQQICRYSAPFADAMIKKNIRERCLVASWSFYDNKNLVSLSWNLVIPDYPNLPGIRTFTKVSRCNKG